MESQIILDLSIRTGLKEQAANLLKNLSWIAATDTSQPLDEERVLRASRGETIFIIKTADAIISHRVVNSLNALGAAIVRCTPDDLEGYWARVNSPLYTSIDTQPISKAYYSALMHLDRDQRIKIRTELEETLRLTDPLTRLNGTNNQVMLFAEHVFPSALFQLLDEVKNSRTKGFIISNDLSTLIDCYIQAFDTQDIQVLKTVSTALLQGFPNYLNVHDDVLGYFKQLVDVRTTPTSVVSKKEVTIEPFVEPTLSPVLEQKNTPVDNGGNDLPTIFIRVRRENDQIIFSSDGNTPTKNPADRRTLATLALMPPNGFLPADFWKKYSGRVDRASQRFPERIKKAGLSAYRVGNQPYAFPKVCFDLDGVDKLDLENYLKVFYQKK